MLQLADPFFRHGLRALLLVSINLRLAASFTSFAEVKYRRIIGQQVTGNQIGVKVSSDIARSSFAHCALNCNYKAADNCRAFYFRPTDCSLSDADDRGVKGRCQLIYIANLTTVTVQASSNACQRLYVIDPCWNSNPCVNSGMCNFIGWPKVCNCQPYYGGTYCENDLLPGLN